VLGAEKFKTLRIVPSLGFLVAAVYFYIFRLFNWDFWDGTIIDRALSEGDLEVLKNWFFEGRGYITYFFYAGIFFISKTLSIPHDLILDIILAVSLGIIFFETTEITRFLRPKDQLAIFASGLMILFFPLWSVLLSSIMIFSCLCVALSLLGVRFVIMNKSHYQLVLGVCLLLISLQLYSNIAAIMGLSILYFLHSEKRGHVYHRARILFGSCIVYLGALLVYWYNFPPYGLYENYNKIVFPTDSMGIKRFLAHYSRFLTPILICFGFFMGIFFHSSCFKGFAKNINYRKFLYTTILLFLWFSMAALPYVLANKSPLFLPYGWSQRHGFTVIPAIAILFALFGSVFKKRIQVAYYVMGLFFFRVCVIVPAGS